MTTAILSFVTPGVVRLRCAELGLDEQRHLREPPPFATWSRIYAAHVDEPATLLALGVLMGRWLDGEERWLERLVSSAVAPLILEVETRTRADQIGVLALDAPWEVVARLDPDGCASVSARWRVHRDRHDVEPPPEVRRELVPLPPSTTSELAAELAAVDLDAAYHLALDPGLLFGPVRRVGPASTPRPPSEHQLSVVYMAAQPDGVAGLDIAGEEVALRAATGDLGLHLTVDESGTLEGLAETLARAESCDIAHVSCHGLAEPRPVLLLEREDGTRIDVDADELAGALAGRPPSLLFLSACSTAGGSTAGRSLASDLCRRGWPGVLGWSSQVGDRGAIGYAARLYRQLARRQRLVDVVASLRRELEGQAGDASVARAWHLPRLYLGAAGGGRITDGTRPRLIQAVHAPGPIEREAALAAGRHVDALARRRALQRTQIALRRGDRVGALLHGGDSNDRAQFALLLLRRWPDLRRVVVTRAIDAVGILGALSRQLLGLEVQSIVERHRDAITREPELLAIAMRELIEGPAQRSGHGAFVLVVHGVDAQADGPAAVGPPRAPAPGPFAVVARLVTAFRGAATESRLVITAARPFAAFDSGGEDVVASLHAEAVGPPG